MLHRTCVTLLALMSISLSHTSGEVEKHRVIVVGAGVSGFAAAAFLLDHNITDLLVLEASDRIGGRIHTVQFGGVTLDKGAEFVHGERDNIVYELVSPYDLLTSYKTLLTEEKITFANTSGYIYNSSLVYTLIDQGWDILNEGTGDFNGSIADYFYPKFNGILRSNNVEPELSQALRHLLAIFEADNTAIDSMEQLGALGESEYMETEGDSTLKWKAGGYKTIFDILSKKFPNASEGLPVAEKILFGKEVTRVELNDGEVLVKCGDGSSYKADHVIITVSLGVLKKHAAAMFQPPLPQKKTSAIQTLGFGCVGKAFLLFPKRWWPDNVTSIIPLFSQKELENFKNTSTNGYWSAHTSGFFPVMNHDRMMCVWFSGKACYIMETLTDEQIMDGLAELLNQVLASHYPQIPKPQNILRTDWASYPFTLGSYSFHTLDSDRHNVTNSHLAEPVFHGDKPVVMFAGEATHSHYWSTVHGALSSGRREATNLLQYMNTHS